MDPTISRTTSCLRRRLLAFVDKAVRHSTNFVWGFPRVHCRYNVSREELQYSQFLPFGPLANADLQWRLIARHDGPKERRSAQRDAILLSFDWVARSFAERVCGIRDHPDDRTPSSLTSFYLYETIPDNWHMWSCLQDDRFEKIARDPSAQMEKIEGTFPIRGSTHGTCEHDSRRLPNTMEHVETSRPKDLRTATTQDILVWRDRILSEAAAHMARKEIEQAEAWLRKLEEATTDRDDAREDRSVSRSHCAGPKSRGELRSAAPAD